MIRIGLACLALGLPLFGLPDRKEIEKRIETVPIEDREVLKEFFRGLLVRGEMGAVLFKYKPMATDFYSAQMIFGCLHRWTHRYQYMSWLFGWHTWLKYRGLFEGTQKKFFGDTELQDDQGVVQIYLYDSQLVGGVLGANFEQQSLEKIFKIKEHAMIGKLLGYPEKDIKAFVDRHNLENILSNYPEGYGTKYIWNEKENPFFCALPYSHRGVAPFFKDSYENELKQKIMDLYNSETFLLDFICLLYE